MRKLAKRINLFNLVPVSDQRKNFISEGIKRKKSILFLLKKKRKSYTGAARHRNHGGENNTTENLLTVARFYWGTLEEDISKYFKLSWTQLSEEA